MIRGRQRSLFDPDSDARLRAGLVAAALQSGSAGNATLVRAGATAILIDCGISPRRLEERLATFELAPRDLAAVFVTHEHADHAGGCGALARRFGTPLYMTEGTARKAAERIVVKKRERECVRVLPRSGFVAFKGAQALAEDDARARDLTVSWIEVPHDAAEPVAFAVEHRGARFGVLTDLGHTPRPVRDWFETLDAALLESNHDRSMLDCGEYPERLKRRIASRRGHLSNEQAARLVRDHASGRLRAVLLAHLSAENNSPALAEDAMRRALGRRSDLDVALHHTRRDGAAGVVEL